jgi:NAD(P)-dependent dehydrogenase (short-subunit alcohol dehydrogenase family)
MVNTIIVTGCAKRIGFGIVDFYLKNSNYKIIGIVRKVSISLNELQKEHPDRLELIIKDLNKDDLDINFFKTIIKNNTEIKGFIHCASNLLFDEIHNFTSENLKSQNRIHYEVFNEAFLAYLEIAKKNNIKSVASFINFGDFKVSNGQNVGISYTHSKLLAINSIKEQSKKGLGYIRVNMVSPGYTLPTEGYDENFEKIVANFPFKYTSSILDICETVDFLIQQRSVTGQHIVVDAGAGLIENI